MPLIRRPNPISVAEARRLYEHTNLPVEHIAAMHGMGVRAFYRRIHRWGWRMRRPELPMIDAPREPDESHGEGLAADAAMADITATAARIHRAVEQELDAVEKSIGQLTPQASEDAERAARTLASLARTLQEVARLNATHVIPPAEGNDDDRGPDDTDEFARELLRRLHEFAARRAKRVSHDADEPSGA